MEPTATVKPYSDRESKKTQVEDMFDTIAPKYDFLNHFLSLGIDKSWRKKAIKMLADMNNPRVLDVATGTGDMAIMAHRILHCPIVGSDLSAGMLDVARQKVADLGLADQIALRQADSEALPFADGEFDAVTVAFGVRNYEDLDKGLADMARVIRKGGRMVVLEFSKPRVFPFRQIYMFYFRHILPRIGGFVSHDRKAYSYLPESVLAFPDGKDFEAHLTSVGLKPLRTRTLTLGIASIYLAEKQ